MQRRRRRRPDHDPGPAADHDLGRAIDHRHQQHPRPDDHRTHPTPTTPTPEPPTTTLEALKTQIAADYVAGHQRLHDLLFNPHAEGLEEKLSTIALPGSPYYEEQLGLIEELIRLGDVVRFGSLRSIRRLLNWLS